MRAKPPKPRKCKVCRGEYTPAKRMQTVCGIDCAKALAQSARVKAERRKAIQERRDTRARLESMKGVPELIREADIAFGAYIRARDAGKPCICCGARAKTAPMTGGEWDAGHFRSRGAASHLRYDERNCHAQLKQCNRRAWDVASYRKNLAGRIGADEVEALECNNATHKWTREELREIRDAYRAKLRELKTE